MSGEHAHGGRMSWQGRLILCVVGFLALAVTTLLMLLPRFQAGRLIGNSSMDSTITPRESFLVSRLAYLTSEPQRGDVIVFARPYNGEDRYFASRIIGLPGDTVEMRSGTVFIDGIGVRRARYVPPGGDDPSTRGYDKYSFVETLPNGVAYQLYDPFDDAPLDNIPPHRVASGHYFVLGDNRDNAVDSRWKVPVGDVPRSSIVGRAFIVYDAIDRKRVGRRIR